MHHSLSVHLLPYFLHPSARVYADALHELSLYMTSLHKINKNERRELGDKGRERSELWVISLLLNALMLFPGLLAGRGDELHLHLALSFHSSIKKLVSLTALHARRRAARLLL